MNTLLISHRGDTVNFHENTVEAFESAFVKGAAGVEMDIQLIAGEIRVVHDIMHDSNGKIPLLETVLQNFAQRGRLEIEVKSFSSEILPPLKVLLEKYNPSDLEVTTSELPLVTEIAHFFPHLCVGVNFDECHFKTWMNEEIYIQKTVGLMNIMGAHVAHLSNLPEALLTPTLIEALQSVGLKTHYHIGRKSLDEQTALYRVLINTGVDQCTFDDINLIDAVRKLSSN